MSKSQTTNRPYYFARRKDTGMMGVWFTHCASDVQREQIIRRILKKAEKAQDSVILTDDIHDTRFRVCFLEKHFAVTVREYNKDWGNSVSVDLTLKVLAESGLYTEKLP
ncbi:hypothetical protein [Aeromonas phage JELG-KS1]|uniref:Uncharacterized protein n=1 Tax=Aeromonas phage JELG-KS1 TaxID=2951233 RepID=A0A9E7NLN9_9CAUD|nr:hypothetical protein [Aeromonas phage JELG-KS1]